MPTRKLIEVALPLCNFRKCSHFSRERGHMVFEYIIRSSPRRRASHSVAEGFSSTASPVYRVNFSIPILPAETR